MEKITERTFKFANRIYKLCKKLQELDNYTDKLLAGQLFRAGTSIGANTNLLNKSGELDVGSIGRK